MLVVLPAVLEDILETHGRLVAYFKQRSWSILLALVERPYTDNKTLAWREMFQANRRYLELEFSGLCEMLHKQLTSQRDGPKHDAVTDVQAFRQNLRNEHQDSQEEQLHIRRTQVQQWLCPIDSELRHKDIMQIIYPGTGEWLLRDHTFQQWSSLDYCANPLLWLNGKPGAGPWASTLFIEAWTDPSQGKLSLHHLSLKKYAHLQTRWSYFSTASIMMNTGMDSSPLLERCCLRL